MSKLAPDAVRQSFRTRRDWLDARRLGVGGSDVAAICGLSPWSTPLDVWLSKRHGAEVRETESMRWGRMLEDPIADVWRCDNPTLRLRNASHFRNRKAPWQLATVDRLVCDRDGAAVGVLEIKTAHTAEGWKAGGVGLGEVPAHYDAQIQWYLHVLGHKRGWFACLVAGRELVTVEVEADGVKQAELVAAADAFWHDNVVANVPPPSQLADLSRLHLLWPADETAPAVALDQLEAHVLGLRRLKDERRETQAEIDRLELLIKQELGSATVGTIAGKVAVTWREVRGRVDTDALVDAVGSAFAERYRREPTRRLVVKDADNAA